MQGSSTFARVPRRSPILLQCTWFQLLVCHQALHVLPPHMIPSPPTPAVEVPEVVEPGPVAEPLVLAESPPGQPAPEQALATAEAVVPVATWEAVARRPLTARDGMSGSGGRSSAGNSWLHACVLTLRFVPLPPMDELSTSPRIRCPPCQGPILTSHFAKTRGGRTAVEE